ncbi:MAG: stage III sporulation protein AE [Christensenellales bacterium]|jgi:stage III sporulation protein AE
MKRWRKKKMLALALMILAVFSCGAAFNTEPAQDAWQSQFVVAPEAGALQTPQEQTEQEEQSQEAAYKIDLEELLMQQAELLDLSELEGALSDIGVQDREAVGADSFFQLMRDAATGQFVFDGQAFLQRGLQLVLGELRNNMGFISSIMGIAILCSLMQQMRDGLSSQGVAKAVYMACYAVIVVLLMQKMLSLADDARQVMQTLSQWMTLLMPVLLVLMSTMGAVASASVFQPVTALMANLVQVVMTNAMLPLTLSAGALTVVNRMGERPRFQKMVGFLKSLLKWGLGVIFTLFIGVLSLQGVAASSFDGLGIRTMKFTLSSTVPIVGGVVSDSLETLLGCSMLLKNGVGIAGIVAALAALIMPVIKIGVVTLTIKLCAALLQPIDSGPIVNCMEEVSDILQILLSCVLTVAMMFFLAIALAVGAGNASFSAG